MPKHVLHPGISCVLCCSQTTKQGQLDSLSAHRRHSSTHHLVLDAPVQVWPGYGVQFFLRNGWGGWQMLGGVLLCITGTEAMFADLGHFNLQAIQVRCESRCVAGCVGSPSPGPRASSH